MSTIKITELTKTCSACPSQWEGRTSDGRHVYVRYRWGCLSVRLADTLDRAVMGKGIGFEWESNDGVDGFMPYAELKTHFTDEIEWPETDGEKDETREEFARSLVEGIKRLTKITKDKR